MNKHIQRTLSILLTLVLLAGTAVPALAAVKILTGDEKAEMITFFNNSVNAIKSETPKATVKYKNYVPDGGLTTAEGDAVDEEVQKYLLPLLEGLFNNRSSVTRGFIRSLMGEDIVTVDELQLHRGMLRNNTVPVYGEDYVSALTPSDEYEMFADIGDNASTPTQLALTFNNMSLEDAKQSSLGKAFSLPSGAIDPMLISGARTEAVSRLDDAKFQSFEIRNAKLVTKYDSKGGLQYYGSTVDYCFEITFYDCMNLISAVLGYDFYTGVINAINIIMDNLGQSEITDDSIMKERNIRVTYRCMVEISDFNFAPRYFGDIDDDGRVTAADSRAALRHAVKLESIALSDDRIYGDVDFDGVITSADARAILRMSVGLDPLFTEVPPGKTIKIVKIEEPVEEPEDPDGPNEPEDPDDDGKLKPIAGLFDDFDPAIKMADIVNAIFLYIGMVEDAEGEVHNYITEFIDAIREAVAEDEEGENP